MCLGIPRELLTVKELGLESIAASCQEGRLSVASQGIRVPELADQEDGLRGS